MPLTLAISLPTLQEAWFAFPYINLYDSSNHKGFKVEKSVFRSRIWSDNNMKETGEEPFFGKSFIFMEADI